MGAVTFRQAKPWDGKDIRAVKQAAIESIDDESYEEEQLSAWKPEKTAVEEFKRAIRSDLFDVLVAETAEDIVGYGVLNVKEDRIDAVFVHPKAMDKGIGSSLVRQFESRAQMHGITELEIISSLNAESFYHSLGYQPVGQKLREIDAVKVEFVIVEKAFDLS